VTITLNYDNIDRSNKFIVIVYQRYKYNY